MLINIENTHKYKLIIPDCVYLIDSSDSLKNIDLTNADFSQSKSFHGMVEVCNNLQSIKIPEIQSGKYISRETQYMIRDNSKLESIYLKLPEVDVPALTIKED